MTDSLSIWRLPLAALVLARCLSLSAQTASRQLGVVNPQERIFSLTGPEDEIAVVAQSTNLTHWSEWQRVLLSGPQSPVNIYAPEPAPPMLFLRAWRAGNPITNSLPEPPAPGSGCSGHGPPDQPGQPGGRDASIPNGLTPIKSIRLLFHVLTDDQGQDPAATLTQVEQQVQTLNEHFRAARIQFVHQTRELRSSYFRYAVNSGTDAVQLRQHAPNPAGQHNIFVTETPKDELGRATYPWAADALTRGGTVTSNARFGADKVVLVHELGHALGLLHPHYAWELSQNLQSPSRCACAEGDPDRTGDRCADTPPTPLNDYGLPLIGADACTGAPWPAFAPVNPMSSLPSPGSRFTPRQAGRMPAWINYTLAGWLDTNTPATPSGLTSRANAFGEVWLSWSDNAWNETVSQVERSAGGGPFVAVATLGAGVTVWLDTTAPPETLCQYSVKAVNGAASSSYSATTPATTSPAPEFEFVDFRNTGSQDGAPAHPWQTVFAGYQAARDGAILKIQEGPYSEALHLTNKVLRLEPVGGPVLIQKP